MRTIRCSSLPLLFKCPASLGGDMRIDEHHELADVGSEGHVLFRNLPRKGVIDWDAIDQYQESHRGELRGLCASAARLWPQIEDRFAGCGTERKLWASLSDDVELTGSADLLQCAPELDIVGDWKTGRKDYDASEQVRGYCVLALSQDVFAPAADGYVIWVRDEEIERYSMRREEIGEWSDLVISKLNQPNVYTPGPHCTFCARAHECQAGQAIMRRNITPFASEEIELCLVQGITAPEAIIDIYRKADMVERLASRVKETLKLRVLNNGDVVCSEGRLTIKRSTQKKLRPVEAWSVLAEAGFDDSDFAACVKLSKTACEARIAKKAMKGQGAAAKRALFAEFMKADAFDEIETTSLVLRRS
jgi:hypothetical protein